MSNLFLADNIADGRLPPAQVPSEGGLVERFKVSRTTVRKAIQNLVERGFVEVTRGKGTFVTQPRITRTRGDRGACQPNARGIRRKIWAA